MRVPVWSRPQRRAHFALPASQVRPTAPADDRGHADGDEYAWRFGTELGDGTRRRSVPEPGAVLLIHAVEVGWTGEEHPDLDDIAECRPARKQDRLAVAQSLPRLGLDRVARKGAATDVHTDQPRDEHLRSHSNRLAVERRRGHVRRENN